MSHKNYHNYSKPYQQPQNAEPVVDPEETVQDIVEPEVQPEVDATVPDEANVEPDVVTESAPELPTTVTGVVSGCKKLNVRTRPNITAGIITAISEGTEVEIAQPIVNEDFYKVTMANGTTGYCMKKFITVK